jgi:hypothetical protein
MTDAEIIAISNGVYESTKCCNYTVEFARAIERKTLERAADVAYAHGAIMATTTAQLIENAIRKLMVTP